MPGKCCVPFCNGNYDTASKVSCFSFPANPELRKKWLGAIKRKDFTPTKYSKVCELHFDSKYIETTTSCYVEATGELLTAPLKRPRLKKDAVPSKLPSEYPIYLSKPSCSYRESPESKRLMLENEFPQGAIAESIATADSYNDNKKDLKKVAIPSKNLPEPIEDSVDIHMSSLEAVGNMGMDIGGVKHLNQDITRISDVSSLAENNGGNDLKHKYKYLKLEFEILQNLVKEQKATLLALKRENSALNDLVQKK